MQAILEKQTALLQSIDKNLSNDRLIQLSQAALQAKTDKDLNADNDETVNALHDLANILKKGIQNKSDTGAHARLDGIKSTLDKSLNVHKETLTTLEKIGDLDTSSKLTQEEKVESTRLAEENNQLLKQLLEVSKKKEKPEEQEKKKDDSSMLGGIGSALAVALGAIVGGLTGYVQAIIKMNKMLFSAVEQAIVAIGKFFPSLKKMLFNIEVTFVLGVEMIKEAFGNFVTKALKIFDTVKDFIGGVVSKIMQSDMIKTIVATFEKVVSTVKTFFAPLTEAFAVVEESSKPVVKAVEFIKSKFAAIGEFFEVLGTKMGTFTKLFGAVAKIASKIAFPLTVIMTIWDTVKGAIEGFEKEGIIGGIAGAIKGLISSLITGPIDMLKGAVSWILDMFGFDKASKFLDSFSFDDIMKSFVDAVFHPIDTIKAMFETIMNFFENFTIPEMGFTVPIINKKVSIGPFQPFKSDKPAEAKQDNSESAKPAEAKVEDSKTSTATKDKPAGLQDKTPTAERQVENDPTYKKAYDNAIAEGKSPEEAKAIAQKAVSPAAAGVMQAPSPITAMPTAPIAQEAAKVYDKSGENQQAAIDNQGSTGPITVTAPTINNTSNNKQSIVTPQPVRNDDNGFNRYTRQNMVMV